MAHEAYYWKTENGSVFFEATDKGMTFDIPETHEIDGESFTLDEFCECFLIPMEDEDEHEIGDLLFVAKKVNKVLTLGLEQDEDFNAEIVYGSILTIKAVH